MRLPGRAGMFEVKQFSDLVCLGVLFDVQDPCIWGQKPFPGWASKCKAKALHLLVLFLTLPLMGGVIP